MAPQGYHWPSACSDSRQFNASSDAGMRAGTARSMGSYSPHSGRHKIQFSPRVAEIGAHARRQAAADQRGFELVGRLLGVIRKQTGARALTHGDGKAVLEEDAIAGQGGDTAAGRQDADDV